MNVLWMLLWILLGILGLVLLYVLFIVGCSFFTKKDKQYASDSKFFRFLLVNLSWIALTFSRVKVYASGIEKLPSKGRYLLVENHRSNFDPIVTWYALSQEQLSFISKPENLKIPVFGRMAKRCCFLEIDRENPKNAVKTIVQASEYIKNGVVSMAVYPEGTRNKTGKGLLPFHNAVFKIAKKAKCPIVVCSICGTEKIRKRAPWRSTKVYLDVIDVIPVEELQEKHTGEIGTIVRKKIEDTLKRVEGENENDILSAI